jgi:hypothetical protein
MRIARLRSVEGDILTRFEVLTPDIGRKRYSPYYVMAMNERKFGFVNTCSFRKLYTFRLEPFRI